MGKCPVCYSEEWKKEAKKRGLPNLVTAEYYCGKVIPAMAALRKTADDLKTITDDELRSMPTYTELLFAR